MKTIKLYNKKGQALLFAIVAMTIALGLGVNIAYRTVSTVSRVTSTDISQRALLVAEGAIERILTKSDAYLYNATTPDSYDCNQLGFLFDSPTNKCYTQFTGDDGLQTKVIVTITRVRTNTSYQISGGGPVSVYQFNVEEGSVTEVNTNGLANNINLNVCWWNLSTQDTEKAVLYYYFWGTPGNNFTLGSKGFLKGADNTDVDVSPANTTIATCPFVNNNTGNYYTTINTGNMTIKQGLRIMSINGPAKVAIWPSTTSTILPYQGYNIVAEANMIQDGKSKIKRTVTVFRSNSYLNSLFDTNFYSGAVMDLN